jgi:hypothetical protein
MHNISHYQWRGGWLQPASRALALRQAQSQRPPCKRPARNGRLRCRNRRSRRAGQVRHQQRRQHPSRFRDRGQGIEKEIETLSRERAIPRRSRPPGTYQALPGRCGLAQEVGMEAQLKVVPGEMDARRGTYGPAMGGEGASHPGDWRRPCHPDSAGGVLFPEECRPDPPGFRRRARRTRVAGKERSPFEQRRSGFRQLQLHRGDLGATRDSVDGTAEFTTRRPLEAGYGSWTRDVPHHPRFGGVIMGLYYHGVTEAHAPSPRSGVPLHCGRSGTSIEWGARDRPGSCT